MREAITTNPQKRVAILVLPSFSNLTLAAVMEPLRAVNRQAGRTLFTWSLLTEEGRPIASSSGLRISPDRSIAEAEPLAEATTDAENHFGPLRLYLAGGFTVFKTAANGTVTVRKQLV